MINKLHNFLAKHTCSMIRNFILFFSIFNYLTYKGVSVSAQEAFIFGILLGIYDTWVVFGTEERIYAEQNKNLQS